MESATISHASDRLRIPVIPVPVAVLGWAGLIAGCWAWGSALNDSGARILLDAPPLFGHFDLQLRPEAAIPLVVAVALVAAAPALTWSLSWRRLLILSGLGAGAWAVALALAEGPGGIHAGLAGPSDYLSAVPLVGSPGEFLSTFTDRIGDYATHVRSHPPGMVLILWALDQLGLGGSAWAAALILVVAASAVPATLLAARAVAGEAAARRAAPFLVLAPGAVWIAITADALFMGVSAWAAALAILALKAEGRRSDRLAVASGALFGVCFFLSFGLTLIGLIPLGVAIALKRARPIVLIIRTVGLFTLVFWSLGFFWVEGFFAIREQYLASIAQTRPYDFFLFNNLAAFAIVLGPAAAIGLARLRDRRLGILVVSALLAVLLADLSGMSKAEVERIWLPFLPWVMLATAALPVGRAAQTGLLAVQAALAITVQLGVGMIW